MSLRNRVVACIVVVLFTAPVSLGDDKQTEARQKIAELEKKLASLLLL
jgi:hypothetical protein